MPGLNAICPICRKPFRLTTRRTTYCSRECAYRRPHETGPRSERDEQQEPYSQEVTRFPLESSIVERTIPGLSQAVKDPLVAFLYLLRNSGYEIVYRKLLEELKLAEISVQPPKEPDQCQKSQS